MRKDDGVLLFIKVSLIAHNIGTATFTNAVLSSALASAATTKKSAAPEGAAATPLGKTQRLIVQPIIYNGSDIENPEPRAPPTTRELAQSVSQASRFERVYVTVDISTMPPPSK